MSGERMSGSTRILSSALGCIAIMVLALAVAGCGSDDDPAAPAGPTGTGTGTMTAFVDGVAWSAVVTNGINQGGIVAIGGSNLNGLLGIGLGFAGTMEDTYPIGPGLVANGNVSGLAGGSWVASNDRGSGVITVTALTATRVTGTFSFTAPATVAGTTPAMRVVTQGTFDVPFN